MLRLGVVMVECFEVQNFPGSEMKTAVQVSGVLLWSDSLSWREEDSVEGFSGGDKEVCMVSS